MTDSDPFPNWLDSLCDTIGSFADIEYQRRVWVRGEGPEIDSFVEAMCRLYDDLSFEEILEEATTGKRLGPNQLVALQNFKVALRTFDRANREITGSPSVRDASIVNHPQWPNVCQQAAVALAALTDRKR